MILLREAIRQRRRLVGARKTQRKIREVLIRHEEHIVETDYDPGCEFCRRLRK